MYRTWLTSKRTLREFAQEYGITRQTLNNWFSSFRDEEILPKKVTVRDAVLIIDGYYVERAACVLIAQTTAQVVMWHFTQTETSSTWMQLLSKVPVVPFAVVCDGQKGILKALKTLWPLVIVQRCQFHVMQFCLLRLTKHPETQAGVELRAIVLSISSVKTRAQCIQWLNNFRAWYHHYQDFLKEKTFQDFSTPTGRRSWHYTHGKLHAAHSHLKHALPHLFQYLRFPEIPNTTNHIEGGTNAKLQEYLHLHRGLSLTQRRQLIALLLRQKQ